MDNFSPLRYPGGKNRMYGYVKYLVDSNDIRTYIEPYCGGAAVALKLLFNGDVEKIMLNDYDRAIYAVWYSMLYNSTAFIERINNVEFSIEEWRRQCRVQEDKKNASLLDLGFSTFYLNRTNRSGIIQAGPIGGKKQAGSYKMDCRFNTEVLKKKVKLIASHKNSIKLYNKDATEFIKKNIVKTKKSLTFFDPPYFEKGKVLYTNFYSFSDHVLLGSTIKNHMKGKKWILTYDVHDEIMDIYSEFNHFEYTLNYSVGGHRKGHEYIFLSNVITSSNIQDYLNLVEYT